jgi:ABC-type Mn2+/Zn2+ transport system permease subunit
MIQTSLHFIHLFPYSIIAGIIIASVCSILGVFVILKRLVFIGITLSETASCGIAAALALHWPPLIGATAFALLTVTVLSRPYEFTRLPRDVVMGIFFVFASGLGLLLVSQSGFGLEEVKALLYGDLILISNHDVKIILGICIPVLIVLIAFIRPILYVFLDREAARILGMRVDAYELLFFISLGLVVSAAAKSAGTLLVFCYLVVTPAAAFLISRRLYTVLLISAAGSVGSTIVGLYWSFQHDLPTNPTVAVVSCIWFAGVYFVTNVSRLVWGKKNV